MGHCYNEHISQGALAMISINKKARKNAAKRIGADLGAGRINRADAQAAMAEVAKRWPC